MLMFCGHRPMHPRMAHRQLRDRKGVFAPGKSKVSADTRKVSADIRKVSADIREVCADTQEMSADAADTRECPWSLGNRPERCPRTHGTCPQPFTKCLRTPVECRADTREVSRECLSPIIQQQESE